MDKTVDAVLLYVSLFCVLCGTDRLMWHAAGKPGKACGLLFYLAAPLPFIAFRSPLDMVTFWILFALERARHGRPPGPPRKRVRTKLPEWFRTGLFKWRAAPVPTGG